MVITVIYLYYIKVYSINNNSVVIKNNIYSIQNNCYFRNTFPSVYISITLHFFS